MAFAGIHFEYGKFNELTSYHGCPEFEHLGYGKFNEFTFYHRCPVFEHLEYGKFNEFTFYHRCPEFEHLEYGKFNEFTFYHRCPGSEHFENGKFNEFTFYHRDLEYGKFRESTFYHRCPELEHFEYGKFNNELLSTTAASTASSASLPSATAAQNTSSTAGASLPSTTAARSLAPTSSAAQDITYNIAEGFSCLVCLARLRCRCGAEFAACAECWRGDWDLAVSALDEAFEAAHRLGAYLRIVPIEELLGEGAAMEAIEEWIKLGVFASCSNGISML